MTNRFRIALRPVVGATLLVLATGLAGCENPREMLGLTHTSPDEFAVISHAPLEVPPEFRLRPPQPGATRPQEGEVRDRARAAVLGAAVNAADLSQGERIVLTRGGGDTARPDIRAIIDRETRALVRGSDLLVDKVLFWQETEAFGSVLDPAAEAERLRANREKGLPPTAGEVPVIERRRGLF